MTILKKVYITLCVLLLCQISNAEDLDWGKLIPAIIQIESSGNCNAFNEKSGAVGCMQLTYPCIKEYANEHDLSTRSGRRGNVMIGTQSDRFTQSFESANYIHRNNIKIGTWYLRRLKDHYLKDNYTLERLLAAYNGGITRLRKVDYDVKKMPRETRAYVKKVLKIMEEK